MAAGVTRVFIVSQGYPGPIMPKVIMGASMVRFDLPPPPPGLLAKGNREVLEAFLAALAAAGASEKTVKAYRAAISDFLEYIGDKPLREVSDTDVAGWVYERLSRGVRRPREGDGRARRVTMHYYTLFLRGFFEWLGLDVKVPVVRKPRRSRVEALRAEDVHKLIMAARDPLDLLIVALLFETGLRAQEAVGLQWRDIDFSRREIRVRNAKYGEERIVLYGQLTEQALQLILATRPPRGPDEPVLGISYSGLYKRLKTLARRAGLDPERVRPHVLRHTFATEALRRGVPLPVVQRLLGHHDIKVTQVYLHILDEDVRRAYQAAFNPGALAQAPPQLAPIQQQYNTPSPIAPQQTLYAQPYSIHRPQQQFQQPQYTPPAPQYALPQPQPTPIAYQAPQAPLAPFQPQATPPIQQPQRLQPTATRAGEEGTGEATA